jgi:hypothetical protein
MADSIVLSGFRILQRRQLINSRHGASYDLACLSFSAAV